MQSVEADSPEVDTLAALRLAIRAFSSAPNDSVKTILILDTGLSTAGICDFNNNLLYADPEAIVSALEERDALPNLAGVRVIWQQLGDVALPQQNLSPRQLNQLMLIWTAIIQASGVTIEISDTPPSTVDFHGNLPIVSTVNLSSEPPITFIASQNTNDLLEEPVFLGERQVQFCGDSAEFADADLAIETIRPIADYLCNQNDLNILLIGTTAGEGNSAFSLSLSESSAFAVKQVLVSLGVNPERILTIGMGNSDPWHISDVGTDGNLAAQNRKVVLLDANSSIAKNILNTDL